MIPDREAYLYALLQDLRRYLDGTVIADPAARTALITVHGVLCEALCPTVMHEARESLRRAIEARTWDGDDIPGPPACAGGGCGED